ncbi:uncharacterized protein LOC111308819 [Durio zibethinus]|uniref:Uncharacterized protein LOC111308819 n=1 Tax=Durio zibethinus TaxID=66656 RepID=A0A6P6AE78_DURZI|nr:uncharacterized protein LOC111308819 [Durio zibethinus]
MNKEEARREALNQAPNSNAANPNNQNQSQGSKGKGKSCKGCLYYSSALKSKSQNPTCVGIPRTLQQVPSYIIGESELEASKEGRTLTDFKYACVGYSVYLDNKDSSTHQSGKQAELPFCVGLEVLLDRTAASTDHVSTPIHKNKDSHTFPQPQTHRSTQSTGDEFYNRFKRNAGLVASGVAKNLNKIGNRIKESLDDILYRRPK